MKGFVPICVVALLVGGCAVYPVGPPPPPVYQTYPSPAPPQVTVYPSDWYYYDNGVPVYVRPYRGTWAYVGPTVRIVPGHWHPHIHRRHW